MGKTPAPVCIVGGARTLLLMYVARGISARGRSYRPRRVRFADMSCPASECRAVMVSSNRASSATRNLEA